MKMHVSENLNQFRQSVRAAWQQPHNPNFAMIIKTADRYETVAALRTFATELGARAIILDVDKEISAEQQELLNRKGPRLVVVSGLDTMSKENLAGFREAINAGGRAMPVVIWEIKAEAPTEEADPSEAVPV